MQGTNYTPVNEFIARGIVESIGRSPYGGWTMMLIVKERRSTLKLSISLEHQIAREIGRKDRVVVRGYTKAFTYHNDALDKDSEVMYFTATSVEHDTPELAQRFGEGLGMFYPEPIFRAFILGKVSKVARQENNAWAQLTVETCGGGRDLRPSFVVLRYYTGGRLPIFDYEVGDVVCARLSAHTPEKQGKNGRTHIYQNLIVEDIAYIDKKQKLGSGQARDPFSIGLENENNIDEQSAGEAITSGDFADDSDLLGNA